MSYAHECTYTELLRGRDVEITVKFIYTPVYEDLHIDYIEIEEPGQRIDGSDLSDEEYDRIEASLHENFYEWC